MNKIIAIFTSDMHLRDTKPKCRIDDYFQSQADKLKQIKILQEENNCPVFDCGDILDNYRSSPFLEGWIIDNIPDQFFTIAGNHDQPNHRIEDIEKGSLGVLIKSKAISLIEVYERSSYSIYGFNFNSLSNKEYIINNKTLKIGLIHEFISIDDFPGSITPEELCEVLKDFDYIFCGHNHINFEKQVGKTKVINIGSMMRMDADQIDHKPCYYVMLEDFTIEKKYFKIVEDVIDRKYIDHKKAIDKNLEAFVNSLNGKYEISNSFKNNIDNYLKENKIEEGIKNKIYGVLN